MDYLIIINKGNPWYLYYIVKQARKYHSAAQIILITDIDLPLHLRRHCMTFRMQDYFVGAARLAPLYEHHSVNSYEFELFCYQRWFILAEFCRKRLRAQDRIIHIDSDLLCYDNLFLDFHRFETSVLGITGFQCPCSMFIPNWKLLDLFCDRIISLYTKERDQLATMYEAWRANEPETAISDMHALHTFISGQGLGVINTSEIHDSTSYDHVLHLSDGFRVVNGLKDLTWLNGQPYAHHLSLDSRIRLKTLHCQGPSKSKILQCFQAGGIGLYFDKFLKRVGF